MTIAPGADRSLHGVPAERAYRAVAEALGPFSGHSVAAGRTPDGRYLRRIEAQAFSVSRWPAAATASGVHHARAQRLVRDTRAANRRFTDRAVAEREGFVQVDDLHWVKPAAVTDRKVLDPLHPEALMYAPSTKTLLGVMYLGDRRAHGPQIGGPETTWHYHLFGAPVCMIHGGFPLELADATGACDAGRREVRSPEMLHVWARGGRAVFDSSMAAMDHAGNHE